MPAAVDLDLAAVAVKLRGPVSAQDRAEKTFLASAAVLAGCGYTEMDLRDLLDREEACLDRSGRRHGRA